MPTVLESLNVALHRAMTIDPTVFILGEDILDPYGGAFKVCRGLSTAFPDRVLTTPISEASITGIATGMALRGLRPVVEIMFGDFTTLIADQLINHAAKFRGMYNEQVRVPMVVRTPMGGRRGYGPTHSQTLEKFFIGAPGLQVVAPCALSLPAREGEPPEFAPGSPGDILLKTILEGEDPVLFVENKLLYPLNIRDEANSPDFTIQTDFEPAQRHPTYRLSIAGAPTVDITITAYGYMTELTCQAALKLAYEHELFAELIIPTRLGLVDLSALKNSVQRTGRLITVEEGTLTSGWGAEVLAQTAAALGPALRSARRVAALEMPIPASRPLEEAALPGISDIIQAALALAR